MKQGVNLDSLTLYEQHCAYNGGHLKVGSNILKSSMSSKISISATSSLVSVPVSKPVISLSLGSVHSNYSINRSSEKDRRGGVIGTSPKVKTNHVHGFRKDWDTSFISDFVCTREPLKYVKEDDEDLRKSSECDESVSKDSNIGDDTVIASSKRKSLTFNQYVDVISIPNRNDYSRRIRAKLWSTAVELHMNASRNTIEFAADGWDWRAATEEDQMPRCPKTKEPIHPIHACDYTQSCISHDERTSSQTNNCQISSEQSSEV
jgi:hypothetical protein